MNFSVYILVTILFTFILLVHSQETSSNDNNKRKKQDFYCSGINKETRIELINNKRVLYIF